MELIQLTILSLIQGLTEFLPISSSAHLILVSTFMNWPDQGSTCLLYTSPSPRDQRGSRMPSWA